MKKGYTLEELNQFEDATPKVKGYTFDEVNAFPDAPTNQPPKMSGFLEALVRPQKPTVPKNPISVKGIYEGAKDIVKATPAIATNLKETVTTRKGLSDLWDVTKNAGVQGTINAVSNANELFWSGAQKGFESIGLETFGKLAGQGKETARQDAKKSSDEIRNFFYGEDLSGGFLDPYDNRSFLEKISAEDGEKEMAKVLGAQFPTFLTLMGITVAFRGANLPSIPATYASSVAFNAGDAYQQGKDYIESTGEVLTPELEGKIQKTAVMAGLTTAVLDTIGMDRILTPSKYMTFKNKFVSKVVNGILDTGVDTIVEGGTETFQEVIQNAYARTYNENQNLFEGAGEAFFGGGIFGGGTSVLVNSAGLLRTGALERLKTGQTGDGVREEIKEGAKSAGVPLSDDDIDKAVSDAEKVYETVVNDVKEKLDSGRSVNSVALELSQNTSVDEAVSFVQRVAEQRPDQKAVQELEGIQEEVTETVLTKSPQDIQNDFDKMQEYIGKQVADLTEKVNSLKEQVDNAENNTPEKKALKVQLENARRELKGKESELFDKVKNNAKAFRKFISDYVSGMGITGTQATEIASSVAEMVANEEAMADTRTIEQIVKEEVAKVSNEGKELDTFNAFNKNKKLLGEVKAKDFYSAETEAKEKFGKGYSYLMKKSASESTVKKKQPTQKEKVKKVVEKKGKANIKEIAKETGILEPNVRRILGMGAKEGEFTRVGEGVYSIKTKDGKEVAVVIPADAVETLPKLAKEGFKADMVFLDIPYDTPAVRGGNRGIKYNLVSVDDFSKVLDAVSVILRDEKAPVIYMYSQAPSGAKAMERYNNLFSEKDFKPIGKGEFQKTFADGSPVTSPNGKVAKPEGIIVFNKSGAFDKELSLNFKLVRPKGYQTEKPAEMLSQMIAMTTEEGDVVLDPFAGSGVTGAEAVKQNRKAVLIEKDKEVAEKITKRRVEQVEETSKETTKEKKDPVRKEAERMADDEILYYLQASEAGRRVFIRSEDSSDVEVRGVPSTFPQFLPDNMRSRKVFDRLLPYWEKKERPSDKTPMLRDLYDIFTKHVEERIIENEKMLQERTNEPEDVIPFKISDEQSFKIKKYVFDVEYGMDDAKRYLEDLKKRLKIDFDTEWVETIIYDYAVDPLRKTRQAKFFAEGLMADNTVAIKRAMDAYTAEHESIHLTLANLDRIEAFRREGITRDKIMQTMADKLGVVWDKSNDLKIEEQIAYDFEQYVHNKKPAKGIIKKFFDALIKLIKDFVGLVEKTNGDIIKDYYDILLEGYSISKEVTTLENKGIVKSFIEDGVLDAHAIAKIVSLKDATKLTTRILKELEGKKTVSKQFILDATNRSELKQTEKDIFRKLLETEGDTVNVESFAKRVRSELLPLSVRNEEVSKKALKAELKKQGLFIEQDMSGEANIVDKDGELVEYDNLPEATQDLVSQYIGNAETYRDIGGQKYENTVLTADIRGNVKDYKENVYESPIKTSAGNAHFPQSTNYFGHTRVEDMADETTRRVIEVQSDLFQKGRFERELDRAGRIGGSMANKTLTPELAQESLTKYETALKNWQAGKRKMSELSDDPYFYADSEEMLVKRVEDWKNLLAESKSGKIDVRKAELSKLSQYNNPTAHFRMIREEIARASEDGKTKLQFPTGETAMKIEGLGQEESFLLQKSTPAGEMNTGIKLTPETMKAGQSIFGHGQDWIITDVLGDGKFKAVPKERADQALENGVSIHSMSNDYKESFDISGKIDTNNPIYRFYEKEIGRYLKNNYKATPVTDKQGVTWYEVDVTPEYGGEVLAFKISEERDGYTQKLKKVFNHTVTKVNKIAEELPKQRATLTETLIEQAKKAELVESVDKDVKNLSRFTKRTKPVGKLTERGIQEAETLEFENPQEAQKEISEYLFRKKSLIETRKQLQQIRRDIQSAKKETKEGKAILRDVERRLRLRRRLLEQKDYYVSMGVGRGKKEQMKMIRRRGVVFSNTQQAIGISDERAKKIVGGRRIHTMSEKEFNDFMQEFVGKAMDVRATLDARDEVKSIVQERQLNKVENLQKALELPTIDKMSEAQATEFANILYQYQFGDTFLTKREMETSIRTKYGDIKTERELLETIEKVTGVNPKELRSIEVTGTDKYRNWYALANKNQFFKWLVERRTLAKIKELNQVDLFRRNLDELVRNARKSRTPSSVSESVWDKLAPTDTEVFKAIETGDFSKLTKEEKVLADFLVTMFRDKYEKLKENFKDFKGRQNYITHIRRTFLETLRDTGSLKEAYTTWREDIKEQENVLEILMGKTGEVLAFDKFLPYMLRRSEKLVPSKNVSRVALTYFSATTRKELLDQFIPEAMITLHGYKILTGQTEKGLDLKPALEGFIKEFLNDAKGRKIETLTKQGSVPDNLWGAFITWVSIKYIGGNPVLAMMNLLGDLLALSVGTSVAQKFVSVPRLFQKNNAKDVIRGIIGENPLVELMNTQEGVAQKVLPVWFSLMGLSSYIANQITVRGLLTREEFVNGVIKDERLIEIADQMNKFKLTPSYGRSLVGRTTTGRGATQFKTYGIPLLITVTVNFLNLVKSAQSRNFTAKNKQEAIELGRTAIYGTLGFMLAKMIIAGLFDDDEEGYIVRQIDNNLNTIYAILTMPFEGIMPPLGGEIEKILTLIKQLVTMERYTKPTDQNYAGDLKALKTFQDVVVPKGATRIFNLTDEEGTPKIRLIEESIEKGNFDAEEVAKKVSQDWEEKTDKAKEDAINNIRQTHTALTKYKDNEVVAIVIGEKNNADKVAKMVQYAQKVGLDKAYNEIKAISNDRELYANQEKKTGAFISAQLFRDFQVEIKKLKKQP